MTCLNLVVSYFYSMEHSPPPLLPSSPPPILPLKFPLIGGGGVQQQKRSCRREKPKMSFVFFVLFCSFSKSTFLCPIWSKMCPQKRTKKIMILVFFDLYQGWRNDLKPGGATFEFSFTMLTRRRFAPPRSQLFAGAFRACDIMTSLQLIYPRHPQDHPPLLFIIQNSRLDCGF